MKIAYFKNGVSNTDTYKNIGWKKLFTILQTPTNVLPLPVNSKKWRRKKEHSDYIIRGPLTAKSSRSDTNLKNCCLLIIDGDAPLKGKKLSSIKQVHVVCRNFKHIVTSTATPKRWRLIVPVQAHSKIVINALTRDLYNYLVLNGINVAWSGESKVASQPWFIGVVTEGAKYIVRGNLTGSTWKPTDTSEKQEKEEFFAHNVTYGSRLELFIRGLESGTIHQVAKAYIGWQLRVTNLTLSQIIEDVSVLIDRHCSSEYKIKRWHSTEKKQLIRWFTKQSFAQEALQDNLILTAPISDAILFDEKRNFPYLSLDIQQPPGSNFKKVVNAILDKQQGVYNPDMAFWFSLVLIDYIAGTGFQSVLSERCDPIYCFTSGDSSQGKTSTIQGAKAYLNEITQSDAFTATTSNKRIISRVGSAEGLYDLVTGALTHGCDIIFIQDEMGSVEQSRTDKSAHAFREMFLYLATIGRNERVEARLLATANKKLKEMARRKDIYCCHFNYFTTTTNETLRGLLRTSDYGSGYLQRFIGGVARSPYFRAKVDVHGCVEPIASFDSSVLDILSTLLERSSSVIGISRITDSLPIQVTKKAKKYHSDLTRACVLNSDVRYSKIAEKILPIARARALVENPEQPVVTLEYMLWAHCVVISSVQYFDWLLKKLHKPSNDGVYAFKKLIVKALKRSGAVSRKTALSVRQLRINKPKTVPPTLTALRVLTLLEEDGKVGKIITKKRGVEVKRWYRIK